MCVVVGDVFHEGTRNLFFTTEEHVEGDGGSCGSEDKQLGVPSVPVDREEELARMARATEAGSGRRWG